MSKLSSTLFILFTLSSLAIGEQLAPILSSVDVPPVTGVIQQTSAECVVPCTTDNRKRVGIWGSADVLVWQPHLRSQDFAVTEDGTSLAIGAGRTHHAELDREAGVRVSLGIDSGTGWGLQFGYTSFSSGGSASVVRPAGTGQLFSTLSHPGGPEEGDVASARTSLDFTNFDIAATTQVICLPHATVSLLGGLRWASIDSELLASFDGRDFVNAEIFDRVDVEAFGLFVGGEAHWRLGHGWSLFGRSTAGILYGRFENTRLETNLGGLEQLVDFRDSFNQPVFNMDARLGVGKSIGCVEFRVGYDMNLWTNVAERLRFGDDIEEATFSSASGDLLLEGFFVQSNVRW